MIKIIVAASNNLVIGKGNELPWSIPSDLQYFKRITTGAVVVMGRKCWESIPVKFRPLVNRKNIVLSRNENYVAEGARTHTNLKDILDEYKDTEETLWVIGGAEIYKEAFEYAEYVHLTNIDQEIDGDVYLEGFDVSKWDLIDKIWSKPQEENGYKFSFKLYKRK